MIPIRQDCSLIRILPSDDEPRWPVDAAGPVSLSLAGPLTVRHNMLVDSGSLDGLVQSASNSD
jgi:hypothetical protein